MEEIKIYKIKMWQNVCIVCERILAQVGYTLNGW